MKQSPPAPEARESLADELDFDDLFDGPFADADGVPVGSTAEQLYLDPMLQEARAARTLPSLSGPGELFWGSLVPLSLMACLGSAALLFVAAGWLLDLPVDTLARVAGIAFAVQLLVVLPLVYYVMRVHLRGPLSRLEAELRGEAPWRPESDLLLGSLRGAVEEVRATACDTKADLTRAEQRIAELQERLGARNLGDRFSDEVAEALRGAESMSQFATSAAEVIRQVWPAEHVALLQRRHPDGELEVVYRESGGRPVEADSDEAGRLRYRHPSLPVAVKEALRRGFYAEAGLPVSRDPLFPEARSFVALALDHRGGAAGVLVAASGSTTVADSEPLRRTQDLFSIAFSRALYLREVEEVAIRDSLTGVFTSNHFLSLLRHEVARANRYSRPAACVLLDIDNLRRVNEQYGAGFGDRVIREVAEIVLTLIRSTDILARSNGGGLALLLPETDLESAVIVAERIRGKIEEHPFLLQPNQVERLTVSVGIAAHPPFGVTALSLVDAARTALAAAKAAGRNRVMLAREANGDALDSVQTG